MAAVKVCPVCSREFAPALTHCPQDGVGLVALNTGAGSRPEELVGQIVEGRYKVERIVGKGGMGTVYAVRHIVVGKVAAMKVLKTGVERADGVLQRFVREAQTANLVKSRHIVEITDFGQLPNGLFYVVMELLEGEDLTRAMKPGKLGRADLVHIFVQVAEALALAHEKGIVHRDLKPDNVFLVNEGGDPRFVKLLDFGIAKVMAGDNPSAGLTETGVILGTPYYMSPEQARAEVVDHRSDIYALGVMMYRAFTGRLPFVADSTMGVLTRHLTETPELPSRLNNVDPATERMIMRCMEKRREARFQSMTEVADALRSIPLTPGAPMREEATVDARGRGAPIGFGPPGLPGQAEPSYSGPQVMSQAIHPAAAASGAYRPSAAPPYPSGAYPLAAPSGPPSYPASAQMSSPPGGWPAQMSSPPGGAWPAAGQVSNGPSSGWPLVSSPPGNGWAGQPMPTPAPMSEPHPGNGGPWPPGTTERGFVTSSRSIAAPRRGGALVIGVGALTMLAVGAVGAVLIYGRRPLAGPATGASAEVPVATVAATITPSAAVAPPPVPTPIVSADPAAPVATTTPSAVAVAVTGRRNGGPQPPPQPKPSASAPVKRGSEIRSPFD
jgi:eukaryotic-like serine/threonine-protein kinase